MSYYADVPDYNEYEVALSAKVGLTIGVVVDGIELNIYLLLPEGVISYPFIVYKVSVFLGELY